METAFLRTFWLNFCRVPPSGGSLEIGNWNASPVDLVVSCPNPADGKPFPLPAGGSLLLVPLDSSNRVAISRKDGIRGVGVPVFWCPVEVVG